MLPNGAAERRQTKYAEFSMRSVWTYLLGSESTLRELHRQSNVRTSTNTLKKSALLSGGHSEWPAEKRKVLRQRKNRHKKAPLKPLSATKGQNTKKAPIVNRRLKRRLPTLPQLNAVPSALMGLTSLFGMGRGGTPLLLPPETCMRT